METTVKERLVRFYEAKGLSKSGFEKMVGLSNGYIDKLRICPSNDKLEMIYLKFPDLNRIWLLTGEGEMLLSSGNEVPHAGEDFGKLLADRDYWRDKCLELEKEVASLQSRLAKYEPQKEAV